MAVALKLSVEQVATAITLLEPKEKRQLRQRLTDLLATELPDQDGLEWTSLAESALDFWLDPAEDIYADLLAISSTKSE